MSRLSLSDTKPDWMYSSYLQDDGATALHIASAAGHTEVVDLLISKGATVDFQDKVHEVVVSIVMYVAIITVSEY